MTDSLNIAMSALQVQRRAMEVTSHNIANSATIGYSRQRSELVASEPENTAPGQLGRGVDIVAIRRSADNLLFDRLRQTDSELGRLSSIRDTMKAVEGLFKEPGDTGLASVTNSMFASFEDLSNNPESSALRSGVVQQMKTWTATLSGLAERLQVYQSDVRTELENRVGKINDLLTQISQLNGQIRTQVVGGNNPNDLMDRRESLVRDLSGHLEVKVRAQKDGTLYLDSGGHLLVGQDDADQLRVGESVDGDVLLLSDTGGIVRATGGAAASLQRLYNVDLPALSAQLDTMATTVAQKMNAIHSTGNSQAHLAPGFTGETVIPPDLANDNLDSDVFEPTTLGGPGIIAAYRPDFTDASGAVVPRNLTINVYDTATKLAQKHVLRYDPTTGTGGRSLDDIVEALNTGHGGGFTLYPPGTSGLAGVNARKAPVDGGFKLELQATNGLSIDFSIALDTKPSASAWTGGTVTVTGTSVAVLPVTRIAATVESGGTLLRLSYRDPDTGATTSLGTAAIPSGGPVAVAGFQVTTGAGTYRDGDSFGIELTAASAVSGGSQTQTAAWVASDATVSLKGRYTGRLTYDPATPWSMRVVSAGVIGNSSTKPVPNNPPVIEFTYYTGSQAAPTTQTVVRTLDDSRPPGSPVEIAEGVYAVFGAGSLTVAGNRLDFIVDGAPDQAGLLPALGVNNMFSGASAEKLSVTKRISDSPSQFDVATTRSEGDNTAIAGLLDMRKARLFSNNSFTLDDYYLNNLSVVGVQIQQSERMSENQEALKASLEGRREEVSGVNIDEEVGALILQQQAYSAAARVVTMARENIQTLLDLLR